MGRIRNPKHTHDRAERFAPGEMGRVAAARALGVDRATLHRWERLGLVTPVRYQQTAGKARWAVYTLEQLDDLRPLMKEAPFRTARGAGGGVMHRIKARRAARITQEIVNEFVERNRREFEVDDG